MFDECVYTKNDVCNLLGITIYTLNNWYRYERKELQSKSVEEPYLPHPMQIQNEVGKPLRWSLEMIDELRVYQKSIIRGRNGRFGKYSNARWH